MSNSFFIFYFISIYNAVTYKRRYPLLARAQGKSGYPPYKHRTGKARHRQNRVPARKPREGTHKARSQHGQG